MSDEHFYARWRVSDTAGIPICLEDDRYRSGCRFAQRMWLLRLVALHSSFVAVCAVLVAQKISGGWWLLLCVWVFIWPHFARQIDYRSTNPFLTERRHLCVDALFAGAFSALMGLNLLPSLLLLMMTTMTAAGAGGIRLLFPALLLFTGALVIVSVVLRIPISFTTSLFEMVLCAPMLLVWPAAFGYISYRTALTLTDHKRQLQLLSTRDGMTGVYNRRHWEHLLQNEYNNCRRYQRPATLLLLDIDCFKTINDTWGHDVGDEAIIAITQHLQLILRMTDTIGRFGGDEFAIIMTGTAADSAIVVAERLHKNLACFRLPAAPQLSLHISIGVAELDHNMGHYREWLKAADIALYKAKNAGRNRTEVAA